MTKLKDGKRKPRELRLVEKVPTTVVMFVELDKNGNHKKIKDTIIHQRGSVEMLENYFSQEDLAVFASGSPHVLVGKGYDKVKEDSYVGDGVPIKTLEYHLTDEESRISLIVS